MLNGVILAMSVCSGERSIMGAAGDLAAGFIMGAAGDLAAGFIMGAGGDLAAGFTGGFALGENFDLILNNKSIKSVSITTAATPEYTTFFIINNNQQINIVLFWSVVSTQTFY